MPAVAGGGRRCEAAESRRWRERCQSLSLIINFCHSGPRGSHVAGASHSLFLPPPLPHPTPLHSFSKSVCIPLSLPCSVPLYLPCPSLKSLPLLRLCLSRLGCLLFPFLLPPFLTLQSAPLPLFLSQHSQGELIWYATPATKSSTFHYVVHVH